MLGPEQASATALILATSQALVDRQVAEWSAKALLLYGGEPKLVYPAQYGAPGFPGEETNIHECKIASNFYSFNKNIKAILIFKNVKFFLCFWLCIILHTFYRY